MNEFTACRTFQEDNRTVSRFVEEFMDERYQGGGVLQIS